MYTKCYVHGTGSLFVSGRAIHCSSKFITYSVSTMNNCTLSLIRTRKNTAGVVNLSCEMTIRIRENKDWLERIGIAGPSLSSGQNVNLHLVPPSAASAASASSAASACLGPRAPAPPSLSLDPLGVALIGGTGGAAIRESIHRGKFLLRVL